MTSNPFLILFLMHQGSIWYMLTQFNHKVLLISLLLKIYIYFQMMKKNVWCSSQKTEKGKDFCSSIAKILWIFGYKSCCTFNRSFLEFPTIFVCVEAGLKAPSGGEDLTNIVHALFIFVLTYILEMERAVGVISMIQTGWISEILGLSFQFSGTHIAQ